MNPIQILVAAVLAVAGGLGGAFAVDKLVDKPKPPSPPPKPETKTSGVLSPSQQRDLRRLGPPAAGKNYQRIEDTGADAFDRALDAAMFTPAAPYAAVVKVIRPHAEGAMQDLMAPPKSKKAAPPKSKKTAPPKPKKDDAPRKAEASDCPKGVVVLDQDKPQDETGFTSVGAVPPKPKPPDRFYKAWSSGQKRYYQAKKSDAQWKKEIDAYNAALKAWNEAVAFDAKITLEKKRIEEDIRRAKSQNEVTALKKRLEAVTKAGNLSKVHGANWRGRPALTAFFQATAQNGVPANLDANKLLEALNAFAAQLQTQPVPGLDPNAFMTPMAPAVSDFQNPWAAQPVAQPQPYAAPPGYAYVQTPMGPQLVPQQAAMQPVAPPGYAYMQTPMGPQLVPQQAAMQPVAPPGYAYMQTPVGPQLVPQQAAMQPVVDPYGQQFVADPYGQQFVADPYDPNALVEAELMNLAGHGGSTGTPESIGWASDSDVEGLEQLFGDQAGWADDSDELEGLDELLSDQAGWADDSDELEGLDELLSDQAGWADDSDELDVGRTDSACCTACAVGQPCEGGACGIGGGCSTC
ncbi:hypothetical protein [Polyangium mundeleinium]|uniref:Uncharacterized protein n=1 Tax=Polyangium mundeleinium TaxID=2995306 RepID=A0ABT5EXZ3_9BACT|nr:hypothetical protein [Polyangium mundeleinium]MDC0746683.1 hypothetical protein [Polyangium mundeleinium]